MSTQTDAAAKGWAAGAQDPPLKRAPTLYAIIFFKLVKGILFLIFGIVLYLKASHNLSQEWADLLKTDFVERLFQILRIHPENKFLQHIADQIADLTESKIKVTAVFTVLFSLFPFVEGAGLIFRASWAGWLAIGESAFFVPIEIYELARQFSVGLLLITLVNILIVWYLYANRERLFRHHHHHH
ncbi:MAG: DUF2127 domain-containing protein [Verrucomicrobiota bacterium]|jgi:uncharacterized membrane protein (DUF2068 family)